MPSINVGRRRARVLVALLSLAGAGACAAQPVNVRTFPEVCPKGWTFLYADYTAQGASSATPPAVCRKDSSTAVAN